MSTADPSLPMAIQSPRSDYALGTAPYRRRFRELAALEPGWLDGRGDRVDRDALELAAHVVAHLSPTLGDPGIFPTPDGGVLIEWASPVQVRSVEITPRLVLECFDLTTREHADMRTLREAIDFFAGVTRAGSEPTAAPHTSTP